MQVDSEKCTGCGECLEVCPVEAISLHAGKAVIDLETCIVCDACEQACPNGAISWTELAIVAKPQPEAPLVQPAITVERILTHRYAPWTAAALSFVGREIVPRLADAFVASLERRSERGLKRPRRERLAERERIGVRGGGKRRHDRRRRKRRDRETR